MIMKFVIGFALGAFICNAIYEAHSAHIKFAIPSLLWALGTIILFGALYYVRVIN